MSAGTEGLRERVERLPIGSRSFFRMRLDNLQLRGARPDELAALEQRLTAVEGLIALPGGPSAREQRRALHQGGGR